MPISSLGSTLVIANPASHSGKGAVGAQVARRFFETYTAATSDFAFQLTTAPGDARTMAAAAAGRDTVIALGGDGVIHEVVNGLMELGAGERPRLGIIPLGSGNDIARTWGMTFNDPETALSELLRGGERAMDLGRVVSDACPEGAFFLETLSFGLDAAIAIDTTERRASGARQQGAGLFVTSSLKLLARTLSSYPCQASLDGEPALSLDSIIFAIQNGPTYGGGFRVCPAAVPTDGALDLCYNVRKPWLGHILALFARLRFGLHTGSPVLCLRTAQTVELDFGDACPPAQADGEELGGSRFSVEVVPAALRVIVPAACPW